MESLRDYLEPSNLSRVARGCTIVTNAGDIARASQKAKRGFTQAFKELASEFECLADEGVDDRAERGLAALAICIGGVTLARALTDRDLIERLLEACSEAAISELGHGG